MNTSRQGRNVINPVDEARVCIVGAGGVGGLIGGRLAATGADVTLVDRDDHLAALRDGGLTLRSADGETTVIDDVGASANTGGLPEQDLVVLGVKTYDLPEAARLVPPVTGEDTVILPVQNGIPWWYFYGFGGDYEGRRIHAIDPDGVIETHVDPERVLGCVPYVAAEVVEPGVVQHVEGDYFPVGEIDGADTERVETVVGLLEGAALSSRVLDDVRSEVWLKAWGNLSFNPISALTGATLAEVCRHPETRALARAMMEEAQVVAEALGATFRRSIERRIEGAESVGDHKTSMLQDAEAGRPLEVEGLIGSVVELAELTGTTVPRIEAVYALTKLLDVTNRGSIGRDPDGKGGR